MIRKYNKSDVSNIILLENKVLHTTLGDSLYLDLDNSFTRHYVYIDDNNNLIGYISSMFDGEMISIENFCVDSNSQNKGIGSSLLEKLLADCYKENPSEIIGAILEVRKSNSRAIHVYEKLGFKVIHIRKNYYSDNEDAIVMQKLFNE